MSEDAKITVSRYHIPFLKVSTSDNSEDSEHQTVKYLSEKHSGCLGVASSCSALFHYNVDKMCRNLTLVYIISIW